MTRYRLSQFIPVPFTSRYRRFDGPDSPNTAPVEARWWQWRGHIFAERTTPLTSLDAA